MTQRGSDRVSAAGDRLLLGLLAAALIGAILQITMGGVVRVTESGLGCPDWPLCHGQIIPPFEYHTLLEYTHRTIGALVGLIFVGAVARAWISHRRNQLLVWSITAGLILISVVGGIGGAVVLSELDPAIRTAHLALAEMVVLAIVLAFASALSGQIPGRGAARQFAHSARSLATTRRLAFWASVITLVALLSGSYAVWRGAGAVCGSWPLCGGPLIPQAELIWIHMAHRLLAGVAAVIALWAAHKAFRLPGAHPSVRALALGALFIVVLQVLMGAANPWTAFEEWAQAGHLTLATLMWTDLTLLAAMLWLQPMAGEAADSQARDLTAD